MGGQTRTVRIWMFDLDAKPKWTVTRDAVNRSQRHIREMSNSAILLWFIWEIGAKLSVSLWDTLINVGFRKLSRHHLNRIVVVTSYLDTKQKCIPQNLALYKKR